MASCGIDRETGLPLVGLAHVVQCLNVIFSSRLGDMVMLRHFGGGLVELLGRRATLRNFALFRTLVALAIDTWEPRLKVVDISAAGNTANAAKLGHFRYTLLCQYRPNALKGDYTVEGSLRSIRFGADGGFKRVTFEELDAQSPPNLAFNRPSTVGTLPYAMRV